jgi:hypothetical protein
LSPSSKHAAEKGKKKTIEEKDQISASTLFWLYCSNTNSSFEKTFLWTERSYGSNVREQTLQYC